MKIDPKVSEFKLIVLSIFSAANCILAGLILGMPIFMALTILTSSTFFETYIVSKGGLIRIMACLIVYIHAYRNKFEFKNSTKYAKILAVIICFGFSVLVPNSVLTSFSLIYFSEFFYIRTAAIAVVISGSSQLLIVYYIDPKLNNKK